MLVLCHRNPPSRGTALYADVRYDGRMKSELDPTTTPEQKLTRFKSALRSVLRVSKDDLTQMLAEEKIRNKGKLKRGPKPRRSSASDRASDNGV
jgi:hypothetical protein